MIPSSLLAAVLFAASMGPGYVWVRVAERRAVRPVRSGLMEAVELVVVGGLASTIAFLVVLASADRLTDWSARSFANRGTEYALEQPTLSLGIVFSALLLSYAGTWLFARIRYFRQPPLIGHGFSGWYQMLSPERGRLVYATVELADRTAVAGWVYSCTVEELPPEQRDLVIVNLKDTKRARMKIRPPGGNQFYEVPDSALILNGREIRAIFARHVQVKPRKLLRRLRDAFAQQY